MSQIFFYESVNIDTIHISRQLLIMARLLTLFISCILLVCNAKVINTDVSSSYFLKVKTGVAQGIHWMSEYIVGKSVDRPPRKVKLALVGMGRTGSTSFSAALKQLGYVPVHDDEAIEVSDIYSAMMDETMTMDEVANELGNRGFDAPMLNLPKFVEWAADEPDVKVILTTRDKSKWAQSWQAIAPVAFLPNQRPFKWIKSIQELSEINYQMMVNIPTNNKPELYNDIPTLEAGFEAWTEYVIKTVPEEKLLVFDVRQGWQPLCNFLDKPIPDDSFPHINDRVVVDVIVKLFVLFTYIWPLIIVLPLLIGYFIIRSCLMQRGKKKEKHA